MDEKTVTREQLDALYETLKKNVTTVNEWHDRLMEACEENAWNDIAKKRSEVLREVYQSNEKLRNDFWEAIPQRLNREECDLLFEFAYRLHTDGIYLVSLGLRLERLLLPYYEERQDYGKIIFLNYAMGYANYLLFDRTLNYAGPSDWLEYFEKIPSYEEHYCEIENEVFRGLFFSAYICLIQYSATYESLKGKTYDYHNAAHALWDREDVQALDGKSAYLKKKIKDVDDQFIYILSINPQLITDADGYCELANTMIGKIGRITIKSDPTGYYKIMENNVKRLKKQFSNEACVASMSDYIQKAIPPLNFDKGDMARTNQLLMNELNCFAYAETMLAELPEDKRGVMDDAINRIINDVVKTPYSFFTYDFNFLFYQLYEGILPYLKRDEEKWNLLNRLILCRQPMTYVHSRMVANIAQMIGKAIIEKKPELLVGIGGCETVEMVREKQEKLLRIFSNCGMTHDIGKCRVAIVINTQDRRLTEDEFGILKYHPTLGAKLLAENETFAPYHDVIIGHHKSYLGEGYPQNFDNTSSPSRILIDLITISDATDAATDALGRNYSTGKAFDKLLQELVDGAGTKYNPDIVAIMKEDTALQKEIAKLTSEGRGELYRKTCIEIKNMHQNADINF